MMQHEKYKRTTGILARAQWTRAEKEAQEHGWSDAQKEAWDELWHRINIYKNPTGALTPEDYADIACSPLLLDRALCLKTKLAARRPFPNFLDFAYGNCETTIFEVTDEDAKRIEKDNYENHPDLFHQPWSRECIVAWAECHNKTIWPELMDHIFFDDEVQGTAPTRSTAEPETSPTSPAKEATSAAIDQGEDVEANTEDSLEERDEDQQTVQMRSTAIRRGRFTTAVNELGTALSLYAQLMYNLEQRGEI